MTQHSSTTHRRMHDSRFVAKMRLVDGKLCFPNSFAKYVVKLFWALRENDVPHTTFKFTFDAKMKQLEASGMYVSKKAHPEHKDILCKKGLSYQCVQVFRDKKQ